MYYTLHMSMGKRVRERQPEMWVATTNFPTAASHPFYTRLNQRLAEHYFDDFVEGQCQPFYAEIMGRPGLSPAMYFRLLLIRYFEGIDSGRGKFWDTRLRWAWVPPRPRPMWLQMIVLGAIDNASES